MDKPMEYIDRTALIERIKAIYCAGCDNYNEIRCRACQIDDALNCIDDAPAADVAPVVHCSDCAYYSKGECDNPMLEIGDRLYPEPDDFCSRYKKKACNTHADRCVCCGDVIPEGRQVCPACEGGEPT